MQDGSDYIELGESLGGSVAQGVRSESVLPGSDQRPQVVQGATLGARAALAGTVRWRPHTVRLSEPGAGFATRVTVAPLYTDAMPEAAHVHFVELAGPDARERLQRQAARWHAQGVATALLRSTDRDDLWLLTGCAATAPQPALVEGARSWRFRRVQEPAA